MYKFRKKKYSIISRESPAITQRILQLNEKGDGIIHSSPGTAQHKIQNRIERAGVKKFQKQIVAPRTAPSSSSHRIHNAKVAPLRKVRIPALFFFTARSLAALTHRSKNASLTKADN